MLRTNQSPSRKMIAGLEFGRSAIAAFFRWWLRELRALAPRAVLEVFDRDVPRIVVFASVNEIYVRREGSNDPHPMLLLRDERLEPQAAGDLLQSANSVTLEFSDEAVARRKVRLPAAAARKARAAIGFMLSRLTPFRAEDVFYAVDFDRADRGRKEAIYHVTVLPKEVVESVRSRLKPFGVEIARVRVAGTSSHPPAEFPEAVEAFGGHQRLIDRAWVPVSIAAIALAVFGPVCVAAALNYRAATLADEAQTLSREARNSLNLRAELSKYESEATVIRTRLASTPASTVLETLAEKLPDDSWAFSIEVTSSAAIVRGFSADVTALMQKLKTPPFSTPELVGPVVHGQVEGKDRFELRLSLESRS